MFVQQRIFLLLFVSRSVLDFSHKPLDMILFYFDLRKNSRLFFNIPLLTVHKV